MKNSKKKIKIQYEIEPEPLKTTELTISGIKIKFPYTPYKIQMNFLKKVIFLKFEYF